MSDSTVTEPRVAALVGPYLSGKTTLLEAMLHASGTLHKRGKVGNGTTIGDQSSEARNHKMSVECNVTRADYLGQDWTFVDCPGSIEFFNEAQNVLMIADIAVVVCEPVPEKAIAAAPLLHFLDQHKIPHIVFINKIDHANVPVREILDALQAVSERPLVLREVPIRSDDQVTGYVDLVSSRAFSFQDDKPSKIIQMPDSVRPREEEARQEMLEALADFDDDLLEKLLEDVEPPAEDVYTQFKKDLAEDLVVPVLLGAAEFEHGIKRLLKTLRHDTPAPETTRTRLSLPEETPLVQVFKTLHLPHIGKLSIGRVWRGTVKDGMTFGEEKISGLTHLLGYEQMKIPSADAGDIVAMGRMDSVRTGDLLSKQGISRDADMWPDAPTPVYAMALTSDKQEDEVKLTAGLVKITEDDPSLVLEHQEDTQQFLLWGQGELHLRIALEKLQRLFNVSLTTARPRISLKETIRNGTSQHARHKKQSGGHGEFGDVHIEISPLSRGDGENFDHKVVGGSVPKQYIPAVEAGVMEALKTGPLGFPVVDVAVTLTDGQHHSVDSSDMAFRKAAIQAIREGLPNCSPVLLEPIYEVRVSIPTTFTSNAQTVLSKRRAQILGFEPKEGWIGWDEISAYLPQGEVLDLIIDIRSQSQGLGWFDWQFSHLSEISGKQADQLIEQNRVGA